jgi:hypothetical protein
MIATMSSAREESDLGIPDPESALEPHRPLQLRYIDYICPADAMRPVMATLQDMLTIPAEILILEPPQDMSGPRENEAITVFAENRADIGRM